LRRVAGPGANELQRLVEQIAERVGHVLERRGLVERDMENAWLAGDGEAGPLDDLIGPSITYRIAVGPRAGQKLFTLQTVPARPPTPRHVAMNWARRLKRVFGIEIEACVRCGGQLRLVASIEQPEVIAKILAHLERVAPDPYSGEWPPGARAPPQWRDSASRWKPRPAHQAHCANGIEQGRRFETTIRGNKWPQ
jgi:hypothetical protein